MLFSSYRITPRDRKYLDLEDLKTVVGFKTQFFTGFLG